MRWKKIFIFAVLLLFLTAQAVPLMATDTAEGTQPIIAGPNHNDGGGDGDGEEHPWQDDDGTGDGTGTVGIVKQIDWLIGLFFNSHKDVQKEKAKEIHNTQKPVKKAAPPEKGKNK